MPKGLLGSVKHPKPIRLSHFFELKDSINQETETTSEEINKIIDDQKSHMTRMQDEIKNKNKDEAEK